MKQLRLYRGELHWSKPLLQLSHQRVVVTLLRRGARSIEGLGCTT